MACLDQTVSASENSDEEEWHQDSDFCDSASENSEESEESYVELDEDQPIKRRSHWKSHDAVELRASLFEKPDSVEHRTVRVRANHSASSAPQRNKELRYSLHQYSSLISDTYVFSHLCEIV